MSSIRIVIAEDDPGLRELAREQLACVPDFQVAAEACDGLEAIADVARLDPDILILDLDLPGIDGFEVLRLVRWFNPNTRVIIRSGHDEEEIIQQTLELGARGYIVKGERTSLEKVIRAVERGEVWARRRVLAQALDHLIGLAGSILQATEGEPAPA
ncbi:MAG: response regulator transcription factor [candidate division NC10 bacterium]|nr:response regulator transcription factor [candidate division NC10 bacterium]MDE2321516.1 response regulator transcription factor [candidate division NC10 bacterium]